MTRFFFHLVRNGERISDDEGAEAADLPHARAEALRAAADLTAEELKMGRPRVSECVIVTDSQGKELLSVAVEAAMTDG